ncbi:bifunctional phosphopantothenoylcysteine decarboxylase/phosphopantothenate--cysteine ligase CoaBC [Granulicella sibirica]|uniref:Coenzyme A biosynthesis bifunctional protein CoaBC n=1 Tax=Granulicella sibirica TaxID=2479048 RepID=A0A4Q0T612_9BACT|nr:bifunctional phosphopantothenoylcysteine decarboxylase/phosphopantothenate--cysteine ligase CoaBC [Granulicella sibirica]RXH58060.1 Phosphopantothenoylcysteine decarboxylase [Granulicella sibirica]
MPDKNGIGPDKVTVGVCGGIAAYKAAELVRALQGKGLDVHVVMTRSAEQFITHLTFASLTGHKVHTSLWENPANPATGDDGAVRSVGFIEHIAEAQSTKVLVVAPATANALARFANGLADDFLSTLYLATTAPVIVAPAMNVNMWNHPATRANVAKLRERGVQVIEPDAGYLACGMVGSGRLADIATIADAVVTTLKQSFAVRDLAGETILITAGGTREPIDPVRFLGNRSSGKMGYALAEAAAQRGARVLLVSAPTALAVPPGCEFVPIIEAAEMQQAVLAHLPEATMVIAAAAVADFRPSHVAAQKIKRKGPITLTLEPTEDIVRAAVAQRAPGTFVIAFAAETEDALHNARAKLLRKGVDAIVVNDVSLPGLGFDSDRNAAIFLTESSAVDLPESPKQVLAHRILDEAVQQKREQKAVRWQTLACGPKD